MSWHADGQAALSTTSAARTARPSGNRWRAFWASAVAAALLITIGAPRSAQPARLATPIGYAVPSPDPCLRCRQPEPRRASAAIVQPNTNSSALATAADPSIVDVTSTLADGEAAGTGMILTATGEILTNNHVIAGAVSITVRISNASQTFPATVVGTDVINDVAILQAQGATGLTRIPLGDSARLAVGDTVVAIGNAFNRPGPPTVTEGTVTGLNRSITVANDAGSTEQLSNLIETNAQLEPGNSGGPLIDATGRVVGMNTAAARGQIPQSGTNDGFAIPINDAVTIVHQIENGHEPAGANPAPPAFLGVSIQNAVHEGDNSHSIGGARNAPDQSGGALVGSVTPASPAADAGVVPGDEIASIDGQGIISSATLAQIIGAKHAGDTVELIWIDQSGSEHRAPVTLAARRASA